MTTRRGRFAAVGGLITVWIARVPVYPALIAASFVLTKFIASWSPTQVLVRPLALAVVAVLAVQVLASVAARNKHQGAYLAAFMFLLAFDQALVWLMFLGPALPLALQSIRRRRVVPLPWPRLTGVLNAIATSTLVLTVGEGAVRGALVPIATLSDPPRREAPATAPDIYLVLLDAYPRADTLLEDFGFDNTPFLESMEALGFRVARESHSNYNLTPLTLASMFNGKHIGDLMPNPPSGLDAQARVLSRLINEGAGIRAARQFGYEIITIPSHVPYLTLFGAGQVLDSGQLNEFEHSILQSESAPDALRREELDWATDQHRQRVLASFNQLNELAAAHAAGPRLVFAHVVAPHLPVVFSADGAPRDGLGCLWQLCPSAEEPLDQWARAAVQGQVEYVNVLARMTGEALAEQTRRPAVVIIFSDHGLRHDPADRGEMLRNLFLSLTPGQPGLFAVNTSPINAIALVLNAYVGADLPLASEESYWLPLSGGLEGFFPLEPQIP